MIIILFNVMGKKNNQTSSRNPNHRVNGFRHYSFTLGLGFLCLHRRLTINSVCPRMQSSRRALKSSLHGLWDALGSFRLVSWMLRFD